LKGGYSGRHLTAEETQDYVTCKHAYDYTQETALAVSDAPGLVADDRYACGFGAMGGGSPPTDAGQASMYPGQASMYQGNSAMYPGQASMYRGHTSASSCDAMDQMTHGTLVQQLLALQEDYDQLKYGQRKSDDKVKELESIIVGLAFQVKELEEDREQRVLCKACKEHI